MKKLMNLIAVALCSICAQAVEFDYEVNWDGTIALTDVRGEIPKKLVIPSIYDGKEVTVIASHFLDGEDRLIPLESLVVSEGVLEIGHEAFADCPWLATVQLPASLKRVEEEAFSGGPDELVGESSFRWSSAVQYGLRQISVASGNQSIVVKDGVLIDVNQGLAIVCCVSAKSVSIPEGVTTIGEDCFAYCLNLETVEFPESLREVGEEAFVFCRSLKRLDFSNTRLRHVNWNCFCGCDSLREVRFPASLRQLGALSFCWCRSLAAVTFLGDAPEISDIDYDDDPGWRSVQANIYVTSNDDLSKPAFVSPAKFKASIMTGVTTYVSPESKGWGAIPGVWQGCPIQYIGSPMTPSIDSSYGPFVPGEKVSLMIPALVGYTAKKLPSGLKLNKKTGEITGAAKKPTGEAGVTVTFTKKNEPTLTAQFVVGPMPTINVTLEGDTEKCKVTGSGDHLVGKKVSLQAKSPKGTAFVGWFRDGEPWPSVEESKKTKLSYVMTKESVSLVATFEKEKMRVACPALASASFTVGVAGAAAGIPIEIETQSGVKSVAVSKLPSGMKYDKKTGLIVGAPTKAGTFNVTIKVTAKSGAVETLVVPVNVASLPDWATGTFGGMIGRFVGPIDDDEFRPYGMITMKITAAGKISAKVTAGGKTYSFSAKGFDFVDEDGDYHFQMATKKGEVYEGEISATYHDVAQLVKVEDADVPEGSFTIVGHEPYFAFVWRNEHGKDGRLSVDPTGKAQKVMDAIKDFKTVELAQFDPAYGSVVLKIDAKGTTKLSGETADGVKISGTSFLMLDDDWYHVISDMVFYDKQSGNVYDVTLCFQPVFDGSGNVVDWDWKCCDHSLRVYPFE